MENRFENKKQKFNIFKTKIFDKIKKIKLLNEEKRLLHKKFKNNKLENISQFMNLVNKTYLKENIYKEQSILFFSKITEYEIIEITNYINSEFRHLFKSKVSIIRFYLIQTNSNYLFDGYKKRLKFYNILKKYQINQKHNEFNNSIIKLITNEENNV